MRISDWSSDVCSSDLPYLDIGLQVWPTAGYPIAGISQHQRLLRQAICILQSNLEIENMVRLSRQRRAIHEIVARGRQRPRTVGVRNGGVPFLHLQLRLIIGIITDQNDPRSEERRVGKESVSTGRS